MNHDEPEFRKKLQKFSLVKQCPMCNQLALTFKNDAVYCSNCGYEEKVPSLRD